jgi:murein DD-endopeptidase MepM/ murein hydrolase activator NlpD
MKNTIKILSVVLVCGFMLAYVVPSIHSAHALTAEEIKKQMEEKQAEIKKLEAELAQYKSQVQGAQAQQKTLKSYINTLNAQIAQLNLEIRITSNKINATELSIEDMELDIVEKGKAVERMKYYMGETVQEIYRSDGNNDLLSFLKVNNISEIFNQIRFRENLQNGLFEAVEKIKFLKTEVETQKSKLEEAKGEYEDKKIELADKQALAGVKKSEKEGVLKVTKNTEAKFKVLVSETEKKQKDIQREIYELEDKLQYAFDPSLLPTARAGVLSMPAKGGVSQGYGNVDDDSITRDFYKFHNGIDIANPLFGTPIKAAADGKVIASGEAPYAYGNWIVIDHENGISTLYGHLSVKKVSVGQVVKRGAVIGLMGGKPGTSGAGLSTGTHVHFTVYATNTFMVQKSKISGFLPVGASVNPMKYL